MLLDAETLKKEGGRGEGKAAEDPLLLKARDEVVDWRWWRQYGGRLMALVVANARHSVPDCLQTLLIMLSAS